MVRMTGGGPPLQPGSEQHQQQGDRDEDRDDGVECRLGELEQEDRPGHRAEQRRRHQPAHGGPQADQLRGGSRERP